MASPQSLNAVTSTVPANALFLLTAIVTELALSCVVPIETVFGVGYRLALSASGRTYLYHTDLRSVRACPPLAAQ